MSLRSIMLRITGLRYFMGMQSTKKRNLLCPWEG